MRNSIKILFFSFVITLVFNSCNNKLNILAPYKESVSVYAILNPQEQYQFIRVNKIYLGEGNAYDMAKIHDSVNYPVGVLSAYLNHAYNSTKITLKDTVLTTKDGAFNTSQNYFYTTTPLYAFGTYTLTVKNNLTGKTFTAQTNMIDSIKPTVFAPLRVPYYPVTYSTSNPASYYIDFSLPAVTRSIKFISTIHASLYSLTMRLHYTDSLNTGSKVARFVDYTLPNITSKTTDGGEDMQFTFVSSEMYSRYYNEILKTDASDILFRKFVKMDFILYAASKDYYDYLQISAPSTSVVQDKPVYTNISDGFGIFAVRSRHHIQKELSVSFIDYMSSNNPMCSLRFLKSNGLQNSSNCQ